MAYAQEKAKKDAAKAKKAKKYIYRPVMFDACDYSKLDLIDGATVVKIQPYGCPKNGTMGMCYVGHPETGQFIGMVCANSLEAK